jgi:methylated-DNA-[protein]-cysteine S-methyltransferase
MSESLYFSSDIINGINFSVIISTNGIREILMNKKSNLEISENVIQISPEDKVVAKVFNQLKEYFSRDRKIFDLSLELLGTDFQKKVWNELNNIPYGETISYGELANRLGDKNLMRAVASANGANPVPIVIPCHRVIGSDGSLTGYGGGLDVKQKLLELEGSWSMSFF